MNAKDVLALIANEGIKIVDFKFMDFPGMWQHFSVPASRIDEEVFEEGLGFDGSSIRGWKQIHESDMLIVPDAATAFVDPFAEVPTLSLIGDIFDPITHEAYGRDPRNIALRAEAALNNSGIADTAFFGPEAEFFVFDNIQYDSTEYSSFYMVDSIEGHWNTGRDESPNLGYKPRYKEGYFPVPPSDSLQAFRNEVTLILESLGIEVEAHHHEVATGGQCEIDLRFNKLVTIADQLMIYKYVIKNVARRYGKTATFMPKPLYGDNGSGMHTHQSLWKGGEPLFAGEGYAGLSEVALHYIGGLLAHAPAVLAFAAPTTNSYKRLVPGYEAPVNMAYSSRNRSAAVRIPMYSQSAKAKRIEFRPPDPSCNPYLAFSAMLMAGLDGIINRIDPGPALDKNLYSLSEAELREVPTLPHSLEGALDALEADHDFLLRDGVFSEDVVRSWIAYKREAEVAPMRLRPHPYEFALYFDI